MKFILTALVLLISTSAWGHCPIPFNVDDVDYCMDLKWQKGDRMVKGKLEPVDQLTPFQNLETEIPQKWVYSKVNILVFKNGDHDHVPVQIPNLRIFPYMTMLDGVHHQASSQLSYDANAGVYVASGFVLQKMQGCWSLRWTTSDQDSYETSTFMTNILEYANLDQIANVLEGNICDVCSSVPVAPTSADGGGHHNH